MPSRRLQIILACLLVILSAVPAPVAAQRVEPGGAPPAGSGPIDVNGFIRAYDGDTFEIRIDGKRVRIGLAGVAAPQGNTDCGKEATDRLQALIKGGLRLDEDASVAFDDRNRRIYRATTRDGKPVSDELAKAGLVRADGRGDQRERVAAAEREASTARRGCVWTKQRAAADAGGISLSALSLSALGDPTVAPQMRALPAVQAEPSAPGVRALAAAPADPAAATELQAVAAAPAATTFPNGFTQDVVASGLAGPTAFTFLPDGRILIAQQNGIIRVFKGGALLSTPLLDIRSRVNTYGDRGLLGLVADPAFATNGFIYVSYTYETDSNNFSGPKNGRISRFTVSGDVASPTSEQVLVGTTVGTPAASSCNAFTKGSDCIASDSPSHSVGNLKFAPDGTLFAIFGDGADFNIVDDNALRAQDLDVLSGKLLRITTTGQGLSSNPFWNGNPSSNRSKVWAYGLRNPFRFNFRPGTSVPYIGDVGWNTWEEINVGSAGANFGWPCYEGNAQQGGYAPKATCQALYGRGASAIKTPLIAYNHDGAGAAVTGGAFYSGTAYPAQYRDAYFYADYAVSFIRSLRVDGSNDLVAGSDTGFSMVADGPVDIELGPDTNLYYLAINTGQLRRIRYTLGNTTPTARASADPTSGATPLHVQFSSSGSADADGDSLQYSWDFGDGTPLDTTANPRHTYATAGTYSAKLTVSDGRGGTATTTVAISAGNAAPTASITAPATTLRYKVGDVITYAGSGTDREDGTIPPSGLSWSITLQHCPGSVCHTHPLQAANGAGGTFTVEDHGDDTFYELTLTAKDSGGLTGTSTVKIQPQTVQVTLATAPTGLQVVYDGTTGTAPMTRTSIVNSRHTITAPTPQNGATFQSWSDGGAAQHNVTLGASNTTYTATYDAPKLLVGHQTVAGANDSNPAGMAEAFQYTAVASGSANRLFVYLDGSNTATKVVVGLYANGASNTAGALLTQGTIATPVAGAWNAVDVPAATVTTGTSYWIAVLNPPGTGAIQLRDTAVGTRAQTSAQSNLTTLPATWSAGQVWPSSPMSAYAAQVGAAPADTQAPTVSLTAPTTGASVSGATVSLAANASDTVGVASVQFLLDGAPLGDADTAAPYSLTWDSRTVANGAHTLGARATDAAGNVGTAASVSVTVANGAADTQPPTVTQTAPTSGATGVGASTNVTATFSEAIDPATVTTSIFTVTKQGATSPVAASVTYAAASRMATLDPSANLDAGGTYTARVKGGSSGVKDAAGNPLAADLTWTFTIVAGGPAPVALVGSTAVGTSRDSNPSGMAEAFQSTATVAGTANRLFVYVDSTNAASQVVIGLYATAAGDAPGTLLAQATIANPTKGAWNSVAIPATQITAGTKYWLAVLGPAGGGKIQFRDAPSGSRALTSAQSNLTALPATWASGQEWRSSPMSAYAAQVP